MSTRRLLTVTVVLLGTVFAALCAKAQQLTTLYNFCSVGGYPYCTDGSGPVGYPIQGSDGNFYGTTIAGGQYQQGTVFKITPSGSLTTLYSFCPQGGDCTDGAQPSAGVIQGSDGNFYGTTVGGGITGTYDVCGSATLGGGVYTCGTIFKLSPEPAGGCAVGSNPGNGYCETVLYSFCSQLVQVNGNSTCGDGSNPSVALLEDSDGNFYGATTRGGGLGSNAGVIFELSPEPEGGCLAGTNPGNGYCEKVMYNTCDTNGCGWGPSALIQGTDGNFYGAMNGGLGVPGDDGTLFNINPSSDDLNTLFYFCTSGSGCPAGDGAEPLGVVQGSDGNFYGTTFLQAYGENIGGSVFQYNPNTNPVLNVLYVFCSRTNCADGQGPTSGVIQGSDGNFYGMTVYGGGNAIECRGSSGCGTIFKVTSTGLLTTLHSFCNEGTPPECTDGGGLVGTGLVQGSDFNFYGTAGGGTNGAGIFFVLAALPVANALPSSVTFGSQDEGTTSPSQPVTLSNTGQEALTVSGISASGDFAQTNNCGGSVAIGSSCTINVTFSPTQTGARTGTLTITDNTDGIAGSVQTVSLNGTGANPAATLSTTSLSFGDQAIDTTSDVKKVTLTSSGTTSLMNISITIIGANAADFTQTSTCAGTLKVNAKCTISVTFTPTLLAAESATLQVSDNAVNSPQTVSLSGTGEAQATLTPDSYTFPETKVGKTSAAHKFTLKNNLPTTLTGISYPTAAPFAVSASTCGTTLDSKKSCTISVTFSPTATGTTTGALTVNDSANDSPQTASLSGTGD